MLTVFIPDLQPAWEGQLRLVCADRSVQVQGQRYGVEAAPGALVTLIRATDKPEIDCGVASALGGENLVECRALDMVVGRPRNGRKASRPSHAAAVKLRSGKRRWLRGGSWRTPVT